MILNSRFSSKQDVTENLDSLLYTDYNYLTRKAMYDALKYGGHKKTHKNYECYLLLDGALVSDFSSDWHDNAADPNDLFQIKKRAAFYVGYGLENRPKMSIVSSANFVNGKVVNEDKQRMIINLLCDKNDGGGILIANVCSRMEESVAKAFEAIIIETVLDQSVFPYAKNKRRERRVLQDFLINKLNNERDLHLRCHTNVYSHDEFHT